MRMKIDVLFVFSTAGGCAGLLPVVQQAVAQGIRSAVLTTEGMQTHALLALPVPIFLQTPAKDLPEATEAKLRQILAVAAPSVIVCGISNLGGIGIEELIQSYTTKPVIIFQDYWGASSCSLNTVPAQYLVLDEKAKELTQSFYGGPISIIGSTKYTNYVHVDPVKLRMQGREAINYDQHEPLVGWFSQPLSHLPGFHKTLSFFLDCLHHAGIKSLFYRKHPAETDEGCQNTISIIKYSGLRCITAPNITLETSLCIPSVVASFFSTCLYDSYMLNGYAKVPLSTPLSLLFEPDICNYWNITSNGLLAPPPCPDAGIACFVKNDVQSSLREALLPKSSEACWKYAKLVVQEHLYGSASQKAVQEIKKWIGRSRD